MFCNFIILSAEEVGMSSVQLVGLFVCVFVYLSEALQKRNSPNFLEKWWKFVLRAREEPVTCSSQYKSQGRQMHYVVLMKTTLAKVCTLQEPF